MIDLSITLTSNYSFVAQPVDLSKPENNDYQVIITTTDAATEKYLNALSFTISDEQVRVIEISLQETVLKKGEDILNTLYEVYIRINEKDKNKIADNTINFIDDHLADGKRKKRNIFSKTKN